MARPRTGPICHACSASCASQKLAYLKSALCFVQRFFDQIQSDKNRLEALVQNQEQLNEKLKKKSNAAREEYGKIFVFSKPHDSDNSEDEFDTEIFASSSIADCESVVTDGNEMDVEN